VPSSNGARKPLDLDAARSARAEAVEETFPFVLGGEEFELMPQNDWPAEVTDFLMAGDLRQAFTLIVVGGTETVQRFMLHRPTLGDYRELFNAVGDWQGVGGLPNSLPLPQPAGTPT
jgi:hypothetical protein